MWRSGAVWKDQIVFGVSRKDARVLGTTENIEKLVYYCFRFGSVEIRAIPSTDNLYVTLTRKQQYRLFQGQRGLVIL